MKTLSEAYAAHLSLPVTTLAICCKITKKNGDVVRGTTHDRDIAIVNTNIGVDLGVSPPFDLTGTYAAGAGIKASDVRSSSDMSVDNMEVEGAIADPMLWIPDLTVADIEAGLYDSAQVTTFRLNWQDPNDFQEVLCHGTLGEVTRTSAGDYRTEVRGLAQVLQQTIGRSCGDRCDVAEFGDHRCKYPVESVTVTGTVTAVTSRKRFDVSITLDSSTEAVQWPLGKLTWVTGENAGFIGQLKDEDVSGTFGQFEMWEAFPLDVEIGDTFTLRPGCDRRYETCRDVYENLINFRGPGIFCPGGNEINRAP